MRKKSSLATSKDCKSSNFSLVFCQIVEALQITRSTKPRHVLSSEAGSQEVLVNSLNGNESKTQEGNQSLGDSRLVG